MLEPIVYATVGICVLLMAMLVRNQMSPLIKALLVSWLMVAVIELLITNSIYQGSANRFAYFKGILPTLHVALLFTYLKAVITEKAHLRWLWHLFPFGLFVALGAFIDHRTLILEYKMVMVILVVVGVYLTMSIRMTISNSSPSIRFLRTVLMIYVTVWAALIAANSLLVEYRRELLWVGMMSFTVLIWVFVFNSLRLEILEDLKVKLKYRKSGMTVGKARSLKKQLQEILEKERPYLNPNLKISDLARQMNINENNISQVINAEFEMSFNDFINHYRVNAFKSLAMEDKKRHLTLFAIAEECGFQSKSTFNAAFKRATGMTPSEFKASLTSDPTRSVA